MLSKDQRFQLEQAIIGQILNFEGYPEVSQYLRDRHFSTWPEADFNRIWTAFEEIAPDPITVVSIASHLRRAACPSMPGLTRVMAEACASVSSSSNLEHDLIAILQDSLTDEVRKGLFELVAYDDLSFHIYSQALILAESLGQRGPAIIDSLLVTLDTWTRDQAPTWAVNQLGAIIGKAVVVEERCMKLKASSLLKQLKAWEKHQSTEYLQDPVMQELINFLNHTNA
jgi:hypothetical protein